MPETKTIPVSMPIPLLDDLNAAVAELGFPRGRSRFVQEALREKLQDMRRRGTLSPVISDSPEKRSA